MKTLLYLILPIVMIAFSCQKEIDVNLNDTQPKLVIVANFIASDSMIHVSITKSSSYFDEYTETVIDNAVVTIQNQSGISTPIPLLANGIYSLENYTPIYGTNYTLSVIHEGIEYKSTSELQQIVTLNPLTSDYVEASFFSEAGHRVNYSFQDPSSLGNAYRIIATYLGERHGGPNEADIRKDELTNGNLIEGELFPRFATGDTITIELQSITTPLYTYYNELLSGTSGFTAAQGNPKYMWSNDALGYFAVYGYDQQQIIIP